MIVWVCEFGDLYKWGLCARKEFEKECEKEWKTYLYGGNPVSGLRVATAASLVAGRHTGLRKQQSWRAAAARAAVTLARPKPALGPILPAHVNTRVATAVL